VERPSAMRAINQMSSSDLPYVEAHDRRLLIVDDDQSVRNLFADYLDESYSCVTAADAYEALERLSHEPFALVLSDMQMPGLGGIELLRKIIERYPDTAVIMISGVDRTQRVIDAIRVGASDYLIKPCELDVLRLCVDRALERRKRLERCLNAFDEVALPPAAAERIREMKTEIGYDDILMDLDSILSDCHIGAERIRDIVQNLRLFSRLDEAELKPVDLNEGIEAT